MIPAREIKDRIKRLRASMKEAGVGAFFVSGISNIEYASGRDTGRVLVTPDRAFLWTKEIYRELYRELYDDPQYPLEVLMYEKDAIKAKVRELGLGTLHVDELSYTQYEKLKADISAELYVSNIVERQRSVKSDHEIALLKDAARIAVKGMEKAYEVVAEGVSEMEALAKIEYEIRILGSESPPFTDGMLLSSGPASADIHAKASGRKMKAGSMAVVDLGGKYGGYYSDMTRTIPVGALSGGDGALLESVESLKDGTIDRLETGMKAVEVHEYVENELAKQGYKFHHSTGHGVGLNVHEAPNLGQGSEDVLTEGMVFTIEPGVYLPGRTGVRFEDMVLLKRNGVEVLTKMKV